jgi:hypothetical protein
LRFGHTGGQKHERTDTSRQKGFHVKVLL